MGFRYATQRVASIFITSSNAVAPHLSVFSTSALPSSTNSFICSSRQPFHVTMVMNHRYSYSTLCFSGSRCHHVCFAVGSRQRSTWQWASENAAVSAAISDCERQVKIIAGGSGAGRGEGGVATMGISSHIQYHSGEHSLNRQAREVTVCNEYSVNLAQQHHKP